MPGQAGSSTNTGRYWIWIRSVSCLFILSSPVVVTVSSSPPRLPHTERWHTREHLAGLFRLRVVCCTFLSSPFRALTRLFLSPNQQVEGPASFPRTF